MNNNTQNEQFDFEEKRESYILRDTLDVIIANWYWFVVSVVVFTLVGYYYSSSRPFLYSKEATIIIKDEKKNGMSPELAAFADVGMGMQSTDVESEVYILKSKYLMARVVERLGLNITYMQKNGLRYIDVYTKTPVILNLVGDVTAGSFGMDITPINVNEASVVYPIKKGELKTQKVNFGDTIATPYFTFVITKGVPFTNSSIDVPVYVNYENTTRSENRYSRKVTVNRADKVTAFVSLSIKDGNAKRAEDILNAMVEMYNIDAIQNKNLIAQNTEDFIVERLSNIKGELGDVDTEVETFKKDNNITDLTQVSSMALTIGETIQKEVVDIEMQKNIVNFFIEYLKDPSRENDLIPSIALEDASINSNISKYNEEMLKYNRMRNATGENNPVFVDLGNALSSSKSALIKSLENTMSSLNIKLKDVNHQNDLINRRIESVPTQEKEIVDIMRQQKIKEELYLYLLNKREENAITLAITEPNARVVDKAYGSSAPISPILIFDLLLAMALGLAVPIIVIFIINLIDTKVRGRQDIERFTTVPIFGELPKKPKAKKNDYIVVSPNGKDLLSEIFNILCFDLNFVAKEKKSRGLVSMMTSSISGEGKTYCALNLALSLAYLGKKVLILDMDLRKTSVSKILLERKTKIQGITNWLVNTEGKTYQDYIVKNIKHENLDLMPAGAIPPNPINILLDTRLDDMVDSMRNEYDYIIIDCVPARIVADAGIISRFIDNTIYVVRSRVLDRRYLLDIEKMYQEGKL
ncbi:MAG: polysaccharide biosynthesis tyrosine autokinase, partial [Rikenellaceae bacterium]